MKVIVDTNVAISANGRDTHASLQCQLNCIEFLQSLVSFSSKAKTAVDAGGVILEEYSKYLFHRGAPGVGDQFFKYLHDNMYSGTRVIVGTITPIDDDNRGFEELPKNQLDKSDRKFAALAVVTGADIYNALDTDWQEAKALFDQTNITIKQLCPDHCPA
ncbi:hypothetical protein [Massilia aerilata]|uniref:PIN domain-containing protein n=1 Tax=Massilia aerilata TaxID=453817 RepID=A0ABW0S2Y7_9BURK